MSPAKATMPRQISTGGDCLIHKRRFCRQKMFCASVTQRVANSLISIFHDAMDATSGLLHWMTRLPKLPLGAPEALVQDGANQPFQTK